MYKKETRYRMDYINAKGENKSCFPRSEEQKDKNIEYAKVNNLKIIKIVKLYPYSTEKNQHNFELVKNRTFNIMHDMETGEIPYDKTEYNRLAELNRKAQELMGLELPVAWAEWDIIKNAKEISSMAINFRMDTCIKNGRFDLLQYC